MRVLFSLLGDRSRASSRVRGYWVAEELDMKGVKCQVIPGGNRRAILECLKRIPFHDIVIFQKDCSKWHTFLIRMAKYLGKKTIFDLDDDLPNRHNEITAKNFEKMVITSSAVVAGSYELAKRLSTFHSNVHHIPTSIKLANYMPHLNEKINGSICIGWIGNGAHYADDLVQVLTEPLRSIGTKHHVRFKIVGACGIQKIYSTFSRIKGIKIDFIDQIAWHDPLAIQNHLKDFDIGLYPLLDVEFNRYKCGFKALEYMAMKLPVVVSPVGINRKIIADGIEGFHAESATEWSDRLLSLVGSKTMRQKMGEAGRLKVEKQYSISAAAKSFQKLFDNLLRMPQGHQANERH